MLKNTEKTMDKLVALCKNRGFVFAGSEIYGGLATHLGLRPLGVEMKTTSSAPGGRSSCRRTRITSASTARSS